MPSGFHALSGREEIRNSAEKFFSSRGMNISFHVHDIVFDGDYAFVQATSKCTIQHLSTGNLANNSGKDLFVLRKEIREWKVYRYMFNE